MFSNFSLIYGGIGISHSFSIISRNSNHHLLNSTILHASVISLLIASNQYSNTIFLPGFSFLPGKTRQSQLLSDICL